MGFEWGEVMMLRDGEKWESAVEKHIGMKVQFDAAK